MLGACTPAQEGAPAVQVTDRLDSPAETALHRELARLAAVTPGSLGACVALGAEGACVNGQRRYSMQSVMKLLVALAAYDAADRGALSIDDTVLVRREDLSVYVQPIAALVGRDGYRTTWRDLARRAVVDSDSAATDVLLARLGGPAAVQRVLEAKGLTGIRIDRNERDLQSETAGLSWRPEFVDPEIFTRAVRAVPEERRAAAQKAYAADVRDTATPRGMVELLRKLAAGELLSPRSTTDLLAVMRQTRTFPTRLRAGAPAGWGVGHKTGSSGAFQGRTTATNDVGLYFPPGGPPIAVAVFLAESPASREERDAAIAAVGRLAAAGLPSS
jgi:beta-lactamase class A